MTRFRGGYDQNSMGETELVAAGGLASLDVEIPVRGTEYRFTTPRGEVAVTARPVSRTMMDSLKQIGLVVLFIVAAVVVVRVVRRLRRRVSPVVIAAGLLILLGLIGMIVLPMAGAALVIVGLAMLAVYGYRSGQRRQSSC